jgi:Tfp pilus assembly protein PilF
MIGTHGERMPRRLKKIPRKYATFPALLSIVVWVLALTGCARNPPVPEERFQRAQHLVDIGTEFLRRRELREARKAFELASDLAPVAAAVDGRGCVALMEGRYADAEDLFGEAYAMDRTYDQALANLALTRELRGEVEDARSMYLKYLDNHPDSAQVRNNLAALEYDRGKGKIGTVEALEKAITLSDQAVIRDNLAVLSRK